MRTYGSPRLKSTVSLEKVMATDMWYICLIILVDFALQDVTVSAVLYQVVMLHL
jgi:hypothetical protein